MTTKTLSTYSAGTYILASAYSELDITKAGGAGAVASNHFATIFNAGTVDSGGYSQIGIGLLAGGAVTNRASGYIGGEYAIDSNISIAVTNYGVIRGGVDAVVGKAGGTITNGGYGSPRATMTGQILLEGGAGTLANFGTVTGFVYMNDGGTITNGGVLDTTATMNGGGGVYMAYVAGTISNFGTIQAYGAPGHNGINLGRGGQIANGAVSDTAARIAGFTGVLLSDVGTVSNFGTIDGAGAAHGAYGVFLARGGSVTNGSAIGGGALIEGYRGVEVRTAAGTVTNWGTILGLGASEVGVYLKAGGKIANGGGGDRTALIEGFDAILVAGGAGTITNSGTIRSAGALGEGVGLTAGGTLTNGSLNNGAALIAGDYGVVLNAQASATNFGTILGTGDSSGAGVSLNPLTGSASLVNGAVAHAGALIEGFVGVNAGQNATVTNFGTIVGATDAVDFIGASDTLVVEAGCAFQGEVIGGGGMLFLDTGAGTLGLLPGETETAAGSMATTTFQAFATVAIGTAATFTSIGAVTIAAGQSLLDFGSLTLGGKKSAIANGGLVEVLGGTAIVSGAVTGKGSALIDGGLLDFTSNFNQNVAFTGSTGTLELAQSQSYSGAISGFAKTGGTFLDLADIGFGGGTTATYSGTKSGGVLTVSDGTHTAKINLKGDYRTSSFVAASDGHGGTVIHDPAAPPAFVAAMAGLAGEGSGLNSAPPWRPEAITRLSSPRASIG